MNFFSALTLQSKIIAILVLIGALSGIYWWVYSSGKAAGQEQQKQENIADTKVQLEEMRKSAEAEFQKVVTASEQAIQAAQSRMLASERREGALMQSLSSLSQARVQSQKELAQVPDAGLHLAIVSSLGLRGSGELNSQPCFTFQEERKILEVLTDYPQAQKQTEILAAQVLEVKAGLQAVKDELAATAKQREAEAALRKTYAQAYTQAYNLLRQKKRSAKCLFLWKCGKEPLLSIPSPDSLSPSMPR